MSKLFILASIAFIGLGVFEKNKKQLAPHPNKSNIHSNTPKELGEVTWLRDIDQATKEAKASQKPIFLLFQEVPGCATCQNYGEEVLSHPLIVEAIETHFVPLAIYNNKGGKDRAVLNYFNEPSWNNPVVRIINHKKQNLIDRISGNYSPLGVVEAMTRILKKQKTEIPEYLNLLQSELNAQLQGKETAYLSMYCFWSGEKAIADIDGVVETDAGFMGGREIVKVDFNPNEISYEDLLKKAKTKSCATHVYSDNLNQQVKAEDIVGANQVSGKSKFRLDQETKYYLYKSSYRYLPMTRLQALKANSLIGKGKSPNHLFSSRQLDWLKDIQKSKDQKFPAAINVPIIEAYRNYKAAM